MSEIRVSGFRIGNTRIEVEGSDGMTLPEICEKLDVRFSGSSFWINGDRADATEASSTVVNPGDHVRIAPKGEGG